ncbi:MAG: XdhC family protein [Chloroflexi bacterium]|nr:XdhC family protein [Chloroflexota bacterium]
MEDIVQLAAEALRQGQRVALVTVTRAVGSTPRSPGAKMLVYPDGSIAGTIGGAAVEARVIQEALTAMGSGAPRNLSYTLDETKSDLGMLCGGTMEVFVDVLIPKPVLLIFGAGHIAQPLAQIGALAGFAVTVVDERVSLLVKNFPQAQRLLAKKAADAVAELPIDASTYVVIVTGGHDSDEEALRRVVGTDAAYIGMIGSRRKVKVVLDRLAKEGVPAERLARVRAPIGLDLGAETPEEIALSIMAEIVKVKKVGSGESLSRNSLLVKKT